MTETIAPPRPSSWEKQGSYDAEVFGALHTPAEMAAELSKMLGEGPDSHVRMDDEGRYFFTDYCRGFMQRLSFKLAAALDI